MTTTLRGRPADHQAMSEERVQTNGIELVYEQIGDLDDPPLLLVMGLGMQLIHWDSSCARRSPSAASG